MARQYHESIESYHSLMEMDAKWLPGYIECGHAHIVLK
jgi:tetratricopeptide (TPR) repeat protein